MKSSLVASSGHSCWNCMRFSVGDRIRGKCSRMDQRADQVGHLYEYMMNAMSSTKFEDPRGPACSCLSECHQRTQKEITHANDKAEEGHETHIVAIRFCSARHAKG